MFFKDFRIERRMFLFYFSDFLFVLESLFLQLLVVFFLNELIKSFALRVTVDFFQELLNFL